MASSSAFARSGRREQGRRRRANPAPPDGRCRNPLDLLLPYREELARRISRETDLRFHGPTFEEEAFGCSRPLDLPFTPGIRQRPESLSARRGEVACNSPGLRSHGEPHQRGVSRPRCSSSGMSRGHRRRMVMSDSTPRGSPQKIVSNALRKAGTVFRRFSSNEMIEPAPTPGEVRSLRGWSGSPGRRFSRRRGVRQEPAKAWRSPGRASPGRRGLDPRKRAAVER